MIAASEAQAHNGNSKTQQQRIDEREEAMTQAALAAAASHKGQAKTRTDLLKGRKDEVIGDQMRKCAKFAHGIHGQDLPQFS